MSVDPALVNALKAALIGAKSIGYNDQAKAHDVYEGYALTLLVRAARDEGASVTYHNGNERRVRDLKFRIAPGLLSGDASFTHIQLEFTPSVEPLELHIGIMGRGYSTVFHECDVAILPRHVGHHGRHGRPWPLTAALASIECKFYAKGVPLGMARAALGLACDGAKGLVLASNKTSTSVATLLSHHHHWHWAHEVSFEGNLHPGSHEEHSAIRSFRRYFRDWVHEHT